MLSTRRPASANNGKRLFEQFVENRLEHLATLRFDFLLAVGVREISIRAPRISSRLVGNRAETLLNSGAKFGSLGAESSSESFCISGSSALIAATRGWRRLTSRSFFVPKTYLIKC